VDRSARDNSRAMEIKPRIIIIGGPNGAGKTTFAREYLPSEAHCDVFVNADLIAAGLSPFAPERVAVRAGKLMLEEIAELVSRGASFALETTLSGLGYARRIPGWRAAGYEVVLHFLSLPSAEYAVTRVARRVRQGGHDIPEDVIHRRFASGRRAFDEIYKPIVDSWMLYDNAQGGFILIDSGKNFEEPAAKQHVAAYDGLPADADETVRGAVRAMIRAAHRAREDAKRWGTELVLCRGGQMVLVDPNEEDTRS
jgi:predicted ABC-type ATPase